MRIFSIGYQRRSLGAFCDTLAAAQVQVLVDVRAAAWSQRPEFRKTAMKNALAERGIEYVHCKAAGNPFRPRHGEALDWAACGAKYAGHLDAHPEVLEELLPLIVGRSAALFCYEGHRNECHRGILLSSLEKKQLKVEIVDL